MFRITSTLAIIGVVAFLDFVNGQSDDGALLYSSRYNNVNVDTILASDRLVTNYVECLLSRKPCPPEGKDLKRILPEALRTKCAKCSNYQREASIKVITKLHNDYPEQYNRLRAKWDPSGEYHRRFEEYLRGIQFNAISNESPSKTSNAASISPTSTSATNQVSMNIDTQRPARNPGTAPSKPETSTTTTAAPPPGIFNRFSNDDDLDSMAANPAIVTSTFRPTAPQRPMQTQAPAPRPTARPPPRRTTAETIIVGRPIIIDKYYVRPVSPFSGFINTIGFKITTTADFIAGMLRGTIQVLRHGVRAPLHSYPNDPYANHTWPGGYGSLLPQGARQAYDLGLHLRSRYVPLLPADGLFSTENMRILSSDAERCLMTAQSMLAGLMPPNRETNLLPIAWQPIPVISIPTRDDYLLKQLEHVCPKYDKILEKFINDPDQESDFFKYGQTLGDLYEYLTNHTGKKIENFVDLANLTDTLKSQLLYGLPLPEWAEDIFFEKMLDSLRRGLNLLTETPYMTRIKGGGLLTEIFKELSQKQHGALARNVTIYSGHDNTLMALFKALNIFNPIPFVPDYGAAISIELHCDDTTEAEADCIVRILYNFNTHEPHARILTMPNCTNPCSLSDFEKAIKPFLIENIAEECKLSSDEVSRPTVAESSSSTAEPNSFAGETERPIGDGTTSAPDDSKPFAAETPATAEEVTKSVTEETTMSSVEKTGSPTSDGTTSAPDSKSIAAETTATAEEETKSVTMSSVESTGSPASDGTTLAPEESKTIAVETTGTVEEVTKSVTESNTTSGAEKTESPAEEPN